MRSSTAFFLLILLVLWSSCRSDFETIESTGNLEFSRDTLFLDTIFSNISTSTYSFKVYNRSNDDLNIPEVALEQGEDSYYRLNVDGIPGKSFENVEILAKDSIYIFVETTVDLQDKSETEFLYEDKLQFRSRAHVQEIPLITLIKDAVFLFPANDAEAFQETIPVGTAGNEEEQTVTAFYLSDDFLNFTNAEPYVVYGYASVPSGKKLVIDAGARIHFHANSGLIISENATLEVKGKHSIDPKLMENEVIFEGDRLEPDFENVPGQWGMIWLKKSSGPHLISNATIKNATKGLFIEGIGDATATVELQDLQIYNSSLTGLNAISSNVIGENVVINNNGLSSLHLTGGNYNFKHSTFTNYWRQSFRQNPAVVIESIAGNGILKADFSNSIFFGNASRELLLIPTEENAFQVSFTNCLIRFSNPENVPKGGFYDFSNENLYKDIILNEDPMFLGPQRSDLRLQEGSAAIDKGNLEAAQEVPFDIQGFSRTEKPDLGAYEWLPSEEETGEK